MQVGLHIILSKPNQIGLEVPIKYLYLQTYHTRTHRGRNINIHYIEKMCGKKI